jgi:hypothetical protein
MEWLGPLIALLAVLFLVSRGLPGRMWPVIIAATSRSSSPLWGWNAPGFGRKIGTLDSGLRVSRIAELT